MIVRLQQEVSWAQVNEIAQHFEELGVSTHLARDGGTFVVGLLGDKRGIDEDAVMRMTGVREVVRVKHPFKLASRQFHPEDTVVQVGNLRIGGAHPVVIAGPCAVEGRHQILEAARQVKLAGAHLLRGGAFKPRSSPYSFQGMQEEGLKLLAEARDATGLGIVSEVMDPVNLPMVAEYVDVLQIGSRNMQNFHLLKELGKVKRPVLLKRGLSATIEEWLMSAEYILSAGNPNVILCERGIRTFENYTRNTLDLNAVPVLKDLSHLPVMVDPSHGIGVRRYVPAMSLAALAAGADGLIIEVHPRPEEALSDGQQSLDPDEFSLLMQKLDGAGGVSEMNGSAVVIH